MPADNRKPIWLITILILNISLSEIILASDNPDHSPFSCREIHAQMRTHHKSLLFGESTEEQGIVIKKSDGRILIQKEPSGSTYLNAPVEYVAGLSKNKDNPCHATLLYFTGSEKKMQLQREMLVFDSVEKCSSAVTAIRRWTSSTGLMPQNLKPVVNCVKGNQNGSDIFQLTREVLEAAGCQLQAPYYTTENPQATRDATAACRQSSPLITGIIVIGGDGTLKHAAEGLTNKGEIASSLPVALVPIGGIHGVATSLKLLHNNHIHALWVIIKALRKQHLVNWHYMYYESFDRQNTLQEKGISFVAIDGGVICDIDKATADTSGFARAAAFLKAAAGFAWSPKPHPYNTRFKIHLSDSDRSAITEDNRDFIFISAMKAPFPGHSYHLAPDSNIRETSFIFRTIYKSSTTLPTRISFLALLSTGGGHSYYEEKVTSRSIAHLIMEKVANGPDEHETITVDGEPCPGTRFEITGSKYPLNFIALDYVKPSIR